VPFALKFAEDFDIAAAFFDAVYSAVKMLDKEISTADRIAWDKAARYLEARR
jgi:hypothetical protein